MNKIIGCNCEFCNPNTFASMRFITCCVCGNKRCPKAKYHGHKCTNSNELDQVPEFDSQ